MTAILDEILDHKARELDIARARVPEHVMAARARSIGDAPRGFRRALEAAAAPVVIAEIKRRSPSKGLIRADFEPISIARAYAAGGAAALSILTDEHFFGGELGFLAKVRAAVGLPLLRKDFVIDPYQIDEARVAGADAVLLIASALDRDRLESLAAHAAELGLDSLVEVHDESELETALEAGARLVGVNNRDLRTFEVDLAVTERLAAKLAARRDVEGILLVAESGIHEHEDIARLEEVGAKAFLVGESLMRQADVAQALRDLRMERRRQ